MADDSKAGVAILIALIGAAGVIGAALIPALHQAKTTAGKDPVATNPTSLVVPSSNTPKDVAPVNNPFSKNGTCSLPGEWVLTELGRGATQGIEYAVELKGDYLTMDIPARQNGSAGKMRTRCAADEHGIITGPLTAQAPGMVVPMPVGLLPDHFERQQDGTYLGERDDGTRFVLHRL